MSWTKKDSTEKAKLFWGAIIPANVATGSLFKHKSTKHLSLKKVDIAFSASPNKRGEILTTLVKRHQMKIVLKKLGRKQQELTDEVKEWLPVRLDSVDI